MANKMLNQFVHLKQPASDYLSQVYQISFKLNDLIEALKDLVSLIQEYTKSSHNLLDKGQIPVKDKAFGYFMPSPSSRPCCFNCCAKVIISSIEY